MAEKKELVIEINEKGEVEIRVEGAKGSSCLEMTRELEEGLGIVRKREKKGSYYEGEERERVAEKGGI